MNWLKLFGWALLIFVVVWFVVWLLAKLLIATTFEGAVSVGAFLDRVDWIVAALSAGGYLLMNIKGKTF